MKVYAVTVFESGDMTTSVWGVFNKKESADKYKKELESDTELNHGYYYLDIKVTEHKLQ